MKVFVTGSRGYVGSRLMPLLTDNRHEAYGVDLPADIRNLPLMRAVLQGAETVIHLACLSNDPTADLDPALTKSINYDSFRPLVKAAKDAGVKRFIFASSSSVYGVKKDPNITEDLPLEPLTDYSKYKAMCEEVLFEERGPGFETVIIRPATVCGYAPNLRLDLCVHILTMAALRRGEITVFGGNQYRPNIHIEDIVDAYLTLLEAPIEKVDGEIFNVGYKNLTIQETAEMVQRICGGKITSAPLLNDPRSYHVSSAKYDAAFRTVPCRSIESAIESIKDAWMLGNIQNADDPKYYRVRQIKEMGLVA